MTDLRRAFPVILLLCAGLMLQACASAARSSVRDTRARDHLREEIRRILSQPELAPMSIGIKAVSLLTGETLFAHHADRLLHPASNTKLFTAVSALKRLGPEYRYTTTVFADSGAFVRNDTLFASLYLRGSGDPLLDTEDLWDMADQIASQDIHTIAGNLIADDSHFDDWRLGAGWMWDDVQYGYSAQISALTVNANAVTVVVTPGPADGDTVTARLEPPTRYMQVVNLATTGPAAASDSAQLVSFVPSDSLAEEADPPAPLRVERQWRAHRNTIVITGRIPLDSEERRYVRTVENPARYAATLFRERLAETGVTLTGEIQTGTAPPHTSTLAVHGSNTLTDALQRMLKDSDNLIAELLIKSIAADVEPPGATEHGLRIARQILTETAGLDTLQYVWVDGSGLSWYNLFTPAQIIDLLVAVYQDRDLIGLMMQALPIAGIDGTLENRMRETIAYRTIRGKTGTLSGVSCLSGFAWSQDDEPLAFSIMMNHYTGSSAVARRAQDDISAALAGFSRRIRLAAR